LFNCVFLARISGFISRQQIKLKPQSACGQIKSEFILRLSKHEACQRQAACCVVLSFQAGESKRAAFCLGPLAQSRRHAQRRDPPIV
jgi:hypothetical protein